jgi:hypothetical protein
MGAQPAASNDTQFVVMTNRRHVMPVIFAGAAAIAMLALFDAAALGTGQTTVASGSVRLVDQATDVPAPPPAPPPGIVLLPGTVLPPGTTVLPGGLVIPPLPPGMVMPPIPPEVSQMLIQGEEMLAAGPPPNVPNEVCRYNTVRVPCPPVR